MILIILDGLGDIGITPLMKARKPHMDALAKEGETGFFWSVGKGLVPGSDIAHMSLFGYRDEYRGRGILEALGIGISISEDAVYFRGNMATVQDGKVIDRRAGRPSTQEVVEWVDRIGEPEFHGLRFRVFPSGEHRVVVEVKGDGAHPIPDLDTHHTGPVILPKEEDRMGKAVRAFLKYVHERLEPPANWILLRGASRYERVEPISERYGIRMAAVTGGALYTGVARYLGMDTFRVGTGDIHTPLDKKVKKAVELAKMYDMVFLHIKGTDVYGHDGDWEGKRRFIEKVDMVLEKVGDVAITGDHSTPAAYKRHSSHPVPLLITGTGRSDDGTFDERGAVKGGLRMVGQELFLYLLDVIGHPKKVGT